jgi:5-methylcytosine-specific restriction endonuclease McrA
MKTGHGNSLFLECEQCGAVKTLKFAEIGARCCSAECAAKYKDKGKTSEQVRLRRSAAYAAWRTAVFVRDDYTCQSCGVRGGRLNADHIKRFADFHELRLDVANGRTLCEGCHRKTETYGNRPQNAATSKWRCVASA